MRGRIPGDLIADRRTPGQARNAERLLWPESGTGSRRLDGPSRAARRLHPAAVTAALAALILDRRRPRAGPERHRLVGHADRKGTAPRWCLWL